MVEEIQLLKNEVVNTKAAHAGLHQSAIEKNAEVSRRFDALNEQLSTMASNGTGGAPGKFKMPPIEPKADRKGLNSQGLCPTAAVSS